MSYNYNNIRACDPYNIVCLFIAEVSSFVISFGMIHNNQILDQSSKNNTTVDAVKY